MNIFLAKIERVAEIINSRLFKRRKGWDDRHIFYDDHSRRAGLETRLLILAFRLMTAPSKMFTAAIMLSC